jgi:hypothetical protein
VKLNAADYGVPYINYYIGVPVIDGEVQHDPAYSVCPIGNVTKKVFNNSDNEGTFRLTWDGNFLYLGIVVWDNLGYTNTLYNDSPEIWNDDAVEIFIDPTNSKLPYFDPNLHRQILVKYSPEGTSPAVSVRGNSAGIVSASKLVYSKIYLGGYSIEVAIPWSNLGVTPISGKYMGFDISVNDDDNGGNRDSQIAWKGTFDNWQNSSLWGTVMLNNTGFIESASSARINLNNTSTSVSVTTSTSVIYPNPVVDQLNIEFAEGATNVKLMNAEGKVFMNENVQGKSMFNASTLNLPNGLYFITITNQDGNIETLKLVK